jgi:hypothetical protein
VAISSLSRARPLHSSRFIHRGGDGDTNLVRALCVSLGAFACFDLWMCVFGTGNAGAVLASLGAKGERSSARGDKKTH